VNILRDRDYGVLKLKFLDDMKRNKVSAGAALLAIHVHAGKHSHTAGILNIPFAYIAADIGITEKEVVESAQELNNAGMILADFDNEILILNSNEYRETFKFPNSTPSIFKKWSKLPDCFIKFRLCKLILTHENADLFDKKDPRMLEEIRKYNDLHANIYNSDLIATICVLNGDLIATTSKQVTSKQVTSKQVNNKDKIYVDFENRRGCISEQQSDVIVEKTKKSKTNSKKLEGFDEYWNRFPNSSKKVKAQEYWVKHQCSTFLDVMFDDLDERERLNPWTPDDETETTGWGWDKRYQYQPGIAPYINQRRWEDSNKQFAKPTKTLTYVEKQKAEAATVRAKRDSELKAAAAERQRLFDNMTNEEREDYEREQEEYVELERELMKNGGFK
jgi:hypothetical protein